MRPATRSLLNARKRISWPIPSAAIFADSASMCRICRSDSTCTGLPSGFCIGTSHGEVWRNPIAADFSPVDQP